MTELSVTSGGEGLRRPAVSAPRRLAALALALCVPLLLYLALVRPWLADYRDNAATIDQLRVRWQRLAADTAGADRLSTQIEQLRHDPRLEGLLLQGATAALAAAALQGRIKALVSEHGASLLSTDALVPSAAGQLSRVGVSVSLRADHSALAALLDAIEQQRPWLFVDMLQVSRYSAAVATRHGRRQSLDVRLHVYGYRQSDPA